MAVIKTNGRYKLENPKFKGLEFSKLSGKCLTWPKVVDFAKKQGGVLPSLYELAAFYSEAGEIGSDEGYQGTRTLIISHLVGNKFYHFIDDIANPELNMVIACAHEGFKSYKENGAYLLPVSNARVKGVFKRAEKSGRIVEANDKSFHELMLHAVNGKSEFGKDDLVKALFLDIAEPFANMLYQDNEYCTVWNITPEELKKSGVDGNLVQVQPLGLDGYPGYDGGVSAYYIFDEGLARAVFGAKDYSGKKIVKYDKMVNEEFKKLIL